MLQSSWLVAAVGGGAAAADEEEDEDEEAEAEAEPEAEEEDAEAEEEEEGVLLGGTKGFFEGRTASRLLALVRIWKKDGEEEESYGRTSREGARDRRGG